MTRYMTQTEIVVALRGEGIEPGLTLLVLEKLAEQNGDAFKLYQMSLELKDQIIAFNYLQHRHQVLAKQMSCTESAASADPSDAAA